VSWQFVYTCVIIKCRHKQKGAFRPNKLQKMKRAFIFRRSILSILLGVLLSIGAVAPVTAIGSPEPTQKGAFGMQGTISSPPPTTPATITTPANNTTSNNANITVNGLCTNGLLVKIFNNGVFVGSVQCQGGSYSIAVDLFNGTNKLRARVFDALDQAGPDSNEVAIQLADNNDITTTARLTLTSNIAKLGAPINTKLTWPIIMSGGQAPYAVSVDWGDGSASDILSVLTPGTFDISHTYRTAGVYRVIVRATDKSGVVAYLQLVGVGSGEVTQTTMDASGKNGGGQTIVKERYVWWPTLLLIPFILVSFWVGTRYELLAIHRRLQRQTQMSDGTQW
jgi:hypothetical protein